MILELVIVVALILVNGVLAMSELAVVSSRPARLRALADGGKRGATTALRLLENPGRFLSSVQIGITLVAILSGAFSGATLGLRLSEALFGAGVPRGVADPLGVGIVVVIITYLSVVLGELVPKQLALRDAERMATRVAPLMSGIAFVAAPLVFLLDISGRTVLRLLGQGGKIEEKVTEEEVRALIVEAEQAGVLETDERHMIAGVMRLADRTARGLMTPRLEVERLDLADEPDAIRELIADTDRSRLVVQEGNGDQVVGVVRVKDVIEALASGKPLDLKAIVQPAPIVMDRSSALDVVRAIRGSRVHMALVFDEYGHFEGVITSGDILEAIVGASLEDQDAEPAFVRREDGSFIVSGWMPVDELADNLGLVIRRDGTYDTIAGYILTLSRRFPQVGEIFEAEGWRFEIMDMDGRRIDKILATRLEAGE